MSHGSGSASSCAASSAACAAASAASASASVSSMSSFYVEGAVAAAAVAKHDDRGPSMQTAPVDRKASLIASLTILVLLLSLIGFVSSPGKPTVDPSV